jgi:predicted amidophosphoribosyltransferase
MTNNETKVCPDCEAEMDESDSVCAECYDPTPQYQWEVTEGYYPKPVVMDEHDPRL